MKTPFSSDFSKEKEAVVQQSLWTYTAALQGEEYTKDDFSKNSIKEAETVLKQPFNTAPDAIKDNVIQGIDSFWDTFEVVGVHAKVLKKN